MDLSIISAEEQDFEGLYTDDWAWSDRLTAQVASEFRRWCWPSARHSHQGPSDFRNAEERAHNLRMLATIAERWADALEAGEDGVCRACHGSKAVELPPQGPDGDPGIRQCPVCEPWQGGFPGWRQGTEWRVPPYGPGEKGEWQG